MNRSGGLCHSLALLKQRRSIPSALLPVWVNLGLCLKEQKIDQQPCFVCSPLPARAIESEVALTAPRLVRPRCYFINGGRFSTGSFYSGFSSWRLILLSFLCSLCFSRPASFLIPPSAVYLSIAAVHLFFSQVYHSLLSAAACPRRLPAPPISLTDHAAHFVSYIRAWANQVRKVPYKMFVVVFFLHIEYRLSSTFIQTAKRAFESRCDVGLSDKAIN